MRLVGRADLPVRSVVAQSRDDGSGERRPNLRDADLIVSGEPREWEAVEYVLDTASAGRPRRA